MDLSGKQILIAVTGGIAAYKLNTLVRDFIKNGAVSFLHKMENGTAM